MDMRLSFLLNFAEVPSRWRSPVATDSRVTAQMLAFSEVDQEVCSAVAAARLCLTGGAFTHRARRLNLIQYRTGVWKCLRTLSPDPSRSTD